MAKAARELIWYSRFQPQTLRSAVVLLYVNAGFSVLFAIIAAAASPGLLVLVDLFAGIGIANDKRWGYGLGLLAAILPIALFFARVDIGGILNLLFWCALFILLVHNHSRQYVRTYFR